MVLGFGFGTSDSSGIITCQLSPLFPRNQEVARPKADGRSGADYPAVDLLKISLVTSEAMGSEASDQVARIQWSCIPHAKLGSEPRNSRTELTATFGGTSRRKSERSEPSSRKSSAATWKESFKIEQGKFANLRSLTSSDWSVDALGSIMTDRSTR